MQHSCRTSVQALLLATTFLAAADAPAQQQPNAPESALTEPYRFDGVAIGGGGYFVGIVYSPVEAGLVFARSDVAGPWAKRSPADDWTPLFTGPVEGKEFWGGASGIAPHPTNPAVVFAELGAGRGESGMGLYKSTDGGASWKHVVETFAASNGVLGTDNSDRKWGEPVAIDPANPGVVYFGSRRGGIFRSTDGGETFEVVREAGQGEGNGGTRSVVVQPGETVDGRSRTVWASVMNKGVFVSRDGGETFGPDEGFAALPGGPASVRWMSMGPDGTLYATHERGLARHREGQGWGDVSPPQSTGLAGVAADPHRAGRAVVIGNYRGEGKTGWGLFRTEDGGQTWRPALWNAGGDRQGRGGILKEGSGSWSDEMAVNAAGNGIALDPHHPGKAYLTDAFFVWHTGDVWADEVSWRDSTAGAENIVAIELATPPAGGEADVPELLAGVSDVRGFVMHDVRTRPGRFVQVPPNWATFVTGYDYCEQRPQEIWATKHWNGRAGIILRSSDGGRTWRAVNRPIEDKNWGATKIAVSATDPEHAVWMASNDLPSHFTTDGGETWRPWTLGDGSPAPSMSQIGFAYWFADPLAADRVDGRAFYAYGHDGRFYTSRDGGATWSANADVPRVNVRDDISPANVVTKPGAAGEVWLATGSGPVRSTDYGQTFTRVEGFESHRPTLADFGAPMGDGAAPTVFVYGKRGGTAGLWRSTDDGRTWRLVPPEDYAWHQPRILAADRQHPGRVYFGDAKRTAIFYGEPAE